MHKSKVGASNSTSRGQKAPKHPEVN